MDIANAIKNDEYFVFGDWSFLPTDSMYLDSWNDGPFWGLDMERCALQFRMHTGWIHFKNVIVGWKLSDGTIHRATIIEHSEAEKVMDSLV
jgi:hypothetical protein